MINLPRLLISKALFIDLARQINTLFYCTSIDLKIIAVACQLLRLFATILDLQIMKCFRGSEEHAPGVQMEPLV